MAYPANPNPTATVDVDYYALAPIFFDIETEGLGMKELQDDLPWFEAPKTYKDPEKIAAKEGLRSFRDITAGGSATGKFNRANLFSINRRFVFDNDSDLEGKAPI